MNISIFGSGYVGLVTGACLADVDNHVICIDVDNKKINQLNNNIVSTYEPGLDNLIQKCRQFGRIEFSVDVHRGVEHGDVIFIAVGTPPKEDGSADLQYVLEVAATIGEYIEAEKVIVNKSTVPVGTADLVKNKIDMELSKRDLDLPFHVVSNPEFLKEGSAISDFMKPDRIVIGTDNSKAELLMRKLYAPFSKNHDIIILMDIKSAELTKYASNAFLATKISFINEIAALAEEIGADIENVRLGIGSDPRIGYQFIYPGCGYGGSCFPKDVRATIEMARDCGLDTKILNAVVERNSKQQEVLFKKVFNYFNGELKGKIFAIWGLSFKPNTDDLREAPSRILIKLFLDEGASIKAYDPEAMPEAKKIFSKGEIGFSETPEKALDDADALIIVTEWKVFQSPDYNDIKKRLKLPLIFDGRNMCDISTIEKLEFTYQSIGRQPIIPKKNRLESN